MYELIRCSA